MEEPRQRHIDFLDPIRGIAILLVFVYHSLGLAFGQDQLPWGKQWFRELKVPNSFYPLLPATLGWAGVTVFFVVSGFCIHLSYSRQPDWSKFFKRRFFRIYPPYVITFLFFALVYPITRLHFTSADFTAKLVSHLLLFYNANGEWVFAVNPSLWSIAVEFQLYALYPVLVTLASRFGWRRALMVVAAIEIGLRMTYDVSHTVYDSGLPRWLSDSPFFFWFSWSVGAFVADLYLKGKSLRVSRRLILTLAILPVACWFLKPLSSMTFPLFALLTASVITSLLENPNRRIPIPDALLGHLQRVGLWSFSLYLWHQPLLYAIPRIMGRVTSHAYIHPLVMFSLCLASWFVIVPIARMSYLFLELPSIAFGKRFYSAMSPGDGTKQVVVT